MDINSIFYSNRQILRFIHNKKEGFWNRERERRPLLLFREAARRVPAYKDFLKRNKINPAKIKTFKDFQFVPPVSKKNYLRQYSLEKLCWDGSLKKPLVWTSTSGSTGEPFYFPRGYKLDWEYSILVQLFLENNPSTVKGPTLVLVCLGMGVWIAGVLSYRAFLMVAERSGYPVSILTPGINKLEILKALKKLAPNFKQTILLGYPPFLKDIVDEAIAEGISLKSLNIRFLSGAEVFTESFRDYLVKRAGVRNLYFDTLNVYGSAEMATMAYETPVAILARRLALKNRKVFKRIFHDFSRTPTLAQYNPFFITFEASRGEILLTGDSSVPLVRYAIGDRGGVMEYGEMIRHFKSFDVNLAAEINKAGIKKFAYQIPFVYVYERSDFSVSFYGVKIYPEAIREILLNKPMNGIFTGKFAMNVKFDAKQNQYWEINLELQKNKKASPKIANILLNKIVLGTRLKSSEFRELSDYLKKQALPRLIFWPSEHSLYFKPGRKQVWISK